MDNSRNLDIVRKCEELGEPYFVLRAQDCLASARVMDWANEAEGAGVNSDRVALARFTARKMRAWPKKKIPD